MDEKVVAYSREIWYKYILLKQPDGFPSGQRGQTVNLLQIASVVRIHLHPLRSILYGILHIIIIWMPRGGAVWKLVGLITRRS